MNFNQIKFGKPVTYLDGVVNYLKGAMVWGFRSKYKWSQTSIDVWGLSNKIVEIVIAYVARVTAASGVVEGQACLQNKLQDLDTKLLLDNASLVLIPSGYKESVLFSEVPTSGLGDLDVVRATTATRVNSEGLIEVVPRNLLQYSNILTNAVWTKTNSTITSGQVSPTQPNNEGWLLNKTATGVDGLVYNAFNLNSLTTHSYSYYILKDNNETRFPEFFLRLNTGQVEQYVQVNTKTGALSVRVASAGCTQSITSTADNLWWRLILTNPAPTAFTADNRHGVIPAAATVFGVYNLNATGSVITYGAQVEEGTTVTEYLPTVTRLNFPRLDYTNGSCPSLLVEPQRTNLALRSEEFNDSAWITNAFEATVTSNLIIAPDGTNSADAIFTTNLLGVHYIQQRTGTATAGTTYTMSVYVKKLGYDYCQISTSNTGTGIGVFRFSTKTLTISGANVVANSGVVTEMADGWFRIQISILAPASAGWRWWIQCLNDSADASFTGDVTKGLYVWGFQFEVGSYATSYIPTTSASVTRNADVISKTGISSLIGQTEGTMFIDVNFKADSVFKNFFNLGTSTSSYIAIVVRSNNKIGAEVLNSGVQVNNEGSTIYTSQRLKIAFAYKANDFAMYVNGVLAFSQNTGSVPAKAEVYLGSYGNGTQQPKDGINSAALWKTRLDNATLAQLTTI